MTLGKKIEVIRKKENYTQEKLAEKVGVSRQTIANWESDITSPDLKQAKKLVEILHISFDDFVDSDTEVECSKKGLLQEVIGKECYLDVDTDDYRLSFLTKCKIIDINKEFIKVEFKHSSRFIVKLLDMNMVHSIKLVEEEKKKK